MNSTEKQKEKYKKVFNIMKDIEYIVNDSIGMKAVYVESIDGNEKDNTSLVITDVCSFTTLNPIATKAFHEAVGLADAINFYTKNDDWIRITMSFIGTCEQEKVETNIFKFKAKQ